MIKITNQQLSAFNSSIINKLLDDDNRPFPIQDAFRIADFIQQINTKIKIYQERAKKVIEAANGEIDGKGFVTYANPDDAKTADREMTKLNSVEVELTGDPLVACNDWPNLSLKEALILKPLLRMNGEHDDDKGRNVVDRSDQHKYGDVPGVPRSS